MALAGHFHLANSTTLHDAHHLDGTNKFCSRQPHFEIILVAEVVEQTSTCTLLTSLLTLADSPTPLKL